MPLLEHISVWFLDPHLITLRPATPYHSHLLNEFARYYIVRENTKGTPCHKTIGSEPHSYHHRIRSRGIYRYFTVPLHLSLCGLLRALQNVISKTLVWEDITSLLLLRSKCHVEYIIHSHLKKRHNEKTRDLSYCSSTRHV